MGRWRRNPFLWFALGVLLLGLVLPVGSMLVRSCLWYEVLERDGTVHDGVVDVVVKSDQVLFYYPPPEGEDEKTGDSLDIEDYAGTRTVFSLRHYRTVFANARTWSLVRNSAVIALGGALFALLLGVPVAWVLARTNVFARPLLAALCLGPAVLPPFFIALGGARRMQDLLIGLFGVGGGTLQTLNSIAVFGFVLFPVYVLLVGPTMAAVPAGAWEAARQMRGPRAAWRHVTLPTVLPAVVGSFVLCTVLALADFAVPDLLGFMLPSGTPTHLYATDVMLQWKKYVNEGRAVATSAPLVVCMLALLLCAWWLLRRSPVFSLARGRRVRAPLALGPGRRWLALGFVVLVLGAALVVPMLGIASWTGEGAWSAASGSEATTAEDTSGIGLFEFSRTLDQTKGSRAQRDRWLSIGLGAALLAMLLAVPLARVATRGGRRARIGVVLVGALPLAMPGVLLSAGTLLFWQALPASWTWLGPLEESILRPVLVLAVKFLPFALVGAWLALRGVHRGQEESAALLGAGPLRRGLRVLLPSAGWGIVAGGLMVLVLALRELEALILIETEILPTLLYDKIHRSRMAQEANLLFLCQIYLLGPALLAALIVALRRRRRRP